MRTSLVVRANDSPNTSSRISLPSRTGISEAGAPAAHASPLVGNPTLSAWGSEKAIRGGAIRVAGYVAGVAVSLGSATILVRHLGVASFGEYVTVTSLAALVGGITEAGIFIYGIREFVARPGERRQQLLAQLLTLRLLLTLLGIGVAVIFGLAVGYHDVIVLGTVVAGAGLLVQVTADVLSVPLQANLELGRLTMIDLGRRVLTFVLIGLLALVGVGIVPFLAAVTTAGVVTLGCLAWIVRASVRIKLSFDLGAWRELVGETLTYAIAMSIAAIYFYVTVIVMSLIASAHQTGLFATSFRVTQVALGIPILLLTAIFPLMSRSRSDQERLSTQMVGKVFMVAVLCGAWMSVAMIVCAPFIIEVIGGTEAKGAVPVLRIQGIALTLTFLTTAASLCLISLRRYRTLILSSSAALVIDILLSVLLVPVLGARGGALADVITESLVALALLFLVRRIVPYRISASFIGAVLLALALSMSVLAIPISPIPRAGLAILMYAAVVLVTGAVPEELVKSIRRLGAARTRSA